ncbi:MAG: cyanophycin synthetase, partial [Pseudomonadota bacterium]
IHRPQQRSGEFTLIDDAYNANPASMTAALNVLAGMQPAKGGKRVAVLGDMLELGTKTAEFHESLADLASMKSIAQVHAVGPIMSSLWNALDGEKRGQCAHAPDQINVEAIASPGDVVLVKGSNASGVSRLVDALKALGKR